MTIIKLKGGLGNQLFQYAFGRVIALRRGEDLKLDKDILGARRDSYRKYGLGHFNIKAEIASPEEIHKYKYPLGVVSKGWRFFKAKFLRIFNTGYNARILQSNKNYFDGYWQTYLYADEIREQLLSELTLKEDINQKYNDLLLDMQTSNSVAIHIRRGDYVADSKTKKNHYTFGLEYYFSALKVISEKISNPKLFIFSDDIKWVKENLKTDLPMVFVSDLVEHDYEELVLMSKCKHNIIANSSFSWWGAWLNQNVEKIAIAPKVWNNHHNDKYKYLIPENWIKI